MAQALLLIENLNVRGLTTAACLWLVAAIGMAAGGGYLIFAISATFIALVFLISLHYFKRIYPKDSYRVLTVATVVDIDPQASLQSVQKLSSTLFSVQLITCR